MSLRVTQPLPLVALLSVTLAHEYYGGAFSQFSLEPLSETLLAGQRLGLKWLRDGPTLTLYATCDRQRTASVAALRKALGGTTLCWQIAPTPDEFATFTDLDFAASQTCLVLTSADRSAAGGMLTAGPTASKADLWPRQSLRFDFLPSKPLATGAVVALETAAGTTLREWGVADPSLVAIDTSAYGAGLYRLTLGGNVLLQWFADSRAPIAASPAVSTVVVLPGALLESALAAALRTYSATQPPVYTATYPAKAVTWRYHIFQAQPEEELAIVAWDDDPTGFSTPEDSSESAPAPRTRARGGKPAGVFEPFADPAFPNANSFEASRPFKLAYAPPQRFALLNRGSTRYAPLPVAAPSSTRAVSTAGYCSDLFVYL